MTNKRSAFAEFLFPSVTVSRAGLVYTLTTPGILRLMGSSSVFVAALMLAIAAIQGILNAPVLIGIALLVPVMLPIAYAVLPPEELRIDRIKGDVVASRIYPGVFRRSTAYPLRQIVRAIAVPQTVTKKSGDSVIVWRLSLQLRDGSYAALLKHNFTEAEAQSIVTEINSMLRVGSADATQEEASKLGQILTERANAAQSSQFLVWVGAAFTVMGLGMIASAHVVPESRHIAQIVSATTKCEFVWRISEKNFERQVGTCDYAPVPARADRSQVPTSSMGLEFDVIAEVAAGKIIDGKVFLTQPEAGFAQKRKVIDVGYSAGRVPAIRHVYPNAQWAFPTLILVIGLSLLIAPLLWPRLRPGPRFANA